MKLLLSRINITLILNLLYVLPAMAQPYQFASPLKIQLGFSGTLGELRSSHFHSGIDIHTQRKTGIAIHASERGYVWRIKVSSTGYGKSIFINHPNGLTTVYAHMERYNDTIDGYVKRHQHLKKSFEVDLFLKPGQIPITKDQVIGYSGNTGNSSGPHLHYEVRETSNHILLQPILFFPSWSDFDKIPPAIEAVYIYQIDSVLYLRDSLQKTKLRLTKHGNRYSINDTIFASGSIGIGAITHDYINQYSTRCDAYEYSMSVNGKVKYLLNFDGLSFSESKHIKSVIDYGHNIDSLKRIVRFWVEPNNTLSLIKTQDKDRGIITIKKDSTYSISLVFKDSWQNISTVDMVVVGIDVATQQHQLPQMGNSTLIRYNESKQLRCENTTIDFAENTFYHNVLVNCSYLIDSTTQIPRIEIQPKRTPTRSSFKLRIMNPLAQSSLAGKAYIGLITPKGTAFMQTSTDGGSFVASCNEFGTYTIAIDTIPPTIVTHNFRPNGKVTTQTWLEFKITDSTGVQSYTGYIDGKWEIFEWDAKSSTLKYKLPPASNTGAWRKIQVEATDLLNNTAKYETKVYW